ncbi:MAG: hydroxymethylbilane synthase [Acidobacteriota bacterium]
MNRVVVGTRGSQLALWQARYVASTLRRSRLGLSVSLRIIRTEGDRLSGQAPAQFPARGIFVRAIEKELLAGRIDLAIHSMKDLPAELAAGTEILAFPAREDPRDVLLTPGGVELDDLPEQAVLGTASPRRQAQIRRRHRYLRFVPMRGNVETRILKMERGEVDGLILALAGLKRLGLAGDRVRPLPEETCLPAPGQGALGVQGRQGDAFMAALVRPLDHTPTRREVQAERALLGALDAGCLVPMAALARHHAHQLELTGLVAAVDGSEELRETGTASVNEAEKLGLAVAAKMKQKGAMELLSAARLKAQERTDAGP